MRSSHDTADPRLVEVLTSEAPVRDRLARGARLCVHAGERRLPPRPLRRRVAQAAPAGRRPDGARDHEGAARVVRGGGGRDARPPSADLAARRAAGWRASFTTPDGTDEVEAATVVLASGGRCFAEAETRGELSTNHPNATGETTRIALDAGAEARDLDALQYHPNGGAWPATMQGYSIPETTRAYGAVLLNADGEEFTDSLGPRDEVSQAIFDEVEAGRGVLTEDGRPAVWLDTTRIAPADAEVSLPYMLRRYRGGGIDPLAEPILTYPVLHYQNGGLVIDTRTPRRPSRASSRAARSPAAPTGETA